jgi:hypothetical protein
MKTHTKKGNAMKKLILGAMVALFSTGAVAGDINSPATKAVPYAYPTTKCGLYFGLNTMGSTGAVNNNTAQIGAQIVQGAIGLTLGWTCPMGTQGYWFVDGMLGFANLNGSTNGFSLTGPAKFEERFGFGAPVNMLISLFPGLANLQSAVPSLIPLPTGVTVNTSNPYIFGAFHQDDVGINFGLGNFRQYLLSAGFGIGTKTRLSNGVVFDPFVEYIMPSTQMCIGPVKGCIQKGNQLNVGMALEF